MSLADFCSFVCCSVICDWLVSDEVLNCVSRSVIWSFRIPISESFDWFSCRSLLTFS